MYPDIMWAYLIHIFAIKNTCAVYRYVHKQSAQLADVFCNLPVANSRINSTVRTLLSVSVSK